MDHKKFSTPLHQCLWDTEDLEIFILVVRKHGGHIPSKSKTEATWKNISEQMKIYASKKNIDSSTWSWKELYDAYKDMRKQLFKEYNIVETHVRFFDVFNCYKSIIVTSYPCT